MRKILFGLLGIIGMFITPGFAEENYLSNLAILGTYTAGAAKPYQIPVRVTNGQTKQIGYVYTSAPLYKLYDVADTIDFQTGQVTHYIKKDVFNGTEQWGYSSYAAGKLFILDNNAKKGSTLGASNFYPVNSFAFGTGTNASMPDKSISIDGYSLQTDGIFLNDKSYTSVSDWKAHLTELYNAGTPLEVYVEANTPTTEQIDLSTLPQMSGTVTYQIAWPEIRVATTKYVESEFAPMVSALANAISVVDTVVSNTITQAASIATLQTQKQTRPNDIADDNEKCPAYKQCLLVEDENGTPHWYEITDPFRDFVTPIIANNVNAASSTSTLGYTQLEYIESTGTQYIDTGVQATGDLDIKTRFKIISYGPLFGVRDVATGASNKSVWVAALDGRTIWLYNNKTTHNHLEKLNLDQWYDADINKGVLSFNGNEVASYETENFTGPDIFLFNTNEANSTLVSGASVQISYFKIYDASGTLVRNFVPVVNNTTGTIGMYDTVGGRFYGNAATSGDDFTAGPIVENDADVPGTTWSATWAADASTGVSAGTVYGITRCNSATAAAGTIITDTTSTEFNTLGNICYCKMTSIDFEGSVSETDVAKWVRINSANGGTKVCLQQCSTWCRGFTTMTERNKPVLSSVL